MADERALHGRSGVRQMRGASPHVESIRRETHSESGSVVTQLTSAAYIHTHISPEAPVFTPDSQRFVYARFRSIDQPRELWICDLGAPDMGAHRLSPLTSSDDEASVQGPIVTPDGKWLVYAGVPEPGEGDAAPVIEVRRRPLDRPDAPSEVICAIEGYQRPYPLGTISPDSRYYATSALRLGGPEDRPIAGILVADLHEGRIACVHEGQDIFNAHVQFDPGAGRDLLIQHNRGGIVDPTGTIVRLVGDIGATFYLIDRGGGNLRRLNIGRPFSRPVQGHQVWLGPTGRTISTLVRRPGDDPDEADLVTVGPGDPRPVDVAGGWRFDHLAVTGDGRYFICDVPPNGEIVVGSVATGTVRVLCVSGTSFGRPQYTHAHPFFSPDARTAFFNSDRTGLGQIYMATIPEGFLASLD